MRLLSAGIVALSLVPTRSDARFYRATKMRAAPGRLVELIDAVKARLPFYDASGETRPFILRHSQGDQWDVMLLESLGPSSLEYFSPRSASGSGRLHRDMVHYATSAVVPPEREEAAARAAGFESRAAIGPYLRAHINAHHDNLLGVVR